MATKYYGINDKWTDDDVANVIEVASEDGTVNSVKVNGVEYGGGGNYTAKITISNSIGFEVQVGVDTAVVDKSGDYELPANTLIAPGYYETTVNNGDTIQIDAIVIPPNGNALVIFDAVSSTYAVTGPATEVTLGYPSKAYSVTGDCSFIITA